MSEVGTVLAVRASLSMAAAVVPALIARFGKGRNPWLWWLASSLFHMLFGGMIPTVIPTIVALTVSDQSMAKVADEITNLNKCDGCSSTFPSFNFLQKVEGRRFLCRKCLADS